MTIKIKLAPFSIGLTVLFLALKLTNTIDWEWVWVLSPLWIGATIWIITMWIFARILKWACKKYGLDFEEELEEHLEK